MSTVTYINTTCELELLKQLEDMTLNGADKNEIDEVKERLVDYLIKTLAYIDMLNDENKYKEMMEGENIKLLEFITTVKTPKIIRTHSPSWEAAGGGESRIIWLGVGIGEEGNKSFKCYGIETLLRNGEDKEVFTNIRV